MDTLKESILSVLSQTVQPDRFVVIDNASTDASRKIAVDMGVEVVDADNRHKFITGLNAAMNLIAGEYGRTKLFFMQNDVVLKKNCLEYMLKDTRWLHGFIAQPVIYDTRGGIDNAGMDFKWPGYGERRNTQWWDGALYERCGLVTTICFMTDKCSEFDERFYPAYYEDVDFYLRTKDSIKHVLIPSAQVIHKGNHTFSQSYRKLEISRICRKNRMKLIRKHYSGLDRIIRAAVTACFDVAKEAVDVIADRWVSANHQK